MHVLSAPVSRSHLLLQEISWWAPCLQFTASEAVFHAGTRFICLKHCFGGAMLLLKTFDGFSLGKTNSLVSNDVSAAFPHDRDSPDSKQLLLLPVSLPMSMDFISPNSEAGLRYFRGPCRPYEWRENDKWYPTLGLNLGEEKKAICGLWRNIQHTFHTREQPLLRPN